MKSNILKKVNLSLTGFRFLAVGMLTLSLVSLAEPPPPPQGPPQGPPPMQHAAFGGSSWGGGNHGNYGFFAGGFNGQHGRGRKFRGLMSGGMFSAGMQFPLSSFGAPMGPPPIF